MRTARPFNPLDKSQLAESVAKALLDQDPIRLDQTQKFEGAGIYSLYYVGTFAPYLPCSLKNRGGIFESPIYIGKAVPKGARKGAGSDDATVCFALFSRLQEHSESISQAYTTLRVCDFFCRYLVTEDIWIPLGESLLINEFSPVWNLVIEGFGIHDPGSGRYKQKRSAWDVLHPGRPWASRCSANRITKKELLESLESHFKLHR